MRGLNTMNDDTSYQIELQALITEREGMIVANKEREMEGKSLAYGEVDFFNLSDRIRDLLR